MTVAQMDKDDENDEFERVYEIHVAPKTANQMRDCPFFVWFTSREEKDRQRQAFGLRCLNCGSDTHFVRDCDKGYMNVSKILNPNLAKGTA
ncbi:unnamed protein product, partial [Ectocarpus fasciculatus]